MSSLTLLTTLVLLMNASRADAHVPPLREDPALQARAQAARKCCVPTGSSPMTVTRRPTVAWPTGRRGENLAMGHTDARSVHAQLMGSPGHRANILRREFDSVGVGSACNITVELFGGR